MKVTTVQLPVGQVPRVEIASGKTAYAAIGKGGDNDLVYGTLPVASGAVIPGTYFTGVKKPTQAEAEAALAELRQTHAARLSERVVLGDQVATDKVEITEVVRQSVVESYQADTGHGPESGYYAWVIAAYVGYSIP